MQGWGDCALDSLKYFFTYDADIPKGLEVKNFSPTHFEWLAVTAIVMVALILIYRRLNPEARIRFTKATVILILVLEIIREAWAASVGHYDVKRMLPLHLCGIMIPIELLAVFTNRKLLREFSFACGLPGALMALLTPEPSGYPLWNIQYLQSIVVHTLIALVPLLWICGDGFRPDIRMLPKNFALLLGLSGFCAVVNLALGSNYMFLCTAPADTPIDLFNRLVGWPWYVGLLLVLVFVIWVIMYLPFELAAFARRRRRPVAAA
jgi:hypothetical integral membrane protein (TIGR02206 family)